MGLDVPLDITPDDIINLLKSAEFEKRLQRVIRSWKYDTMTEHTFAAFAFTCAWEYLYGQLKRKLSNPLLLEFEKPFPEGFVCPQECGRTKMKGDLVLECFSDVNRVPSA